MDDLQGIFRISAQLQMPQQRHLPLDAFLEHHVVGIEATEEATSPWRIYSPRIMTYPRLILMVLLGLIGY
jgi:hypothetical protein